MLEILAPAGNRECAETAIANGANALYLGFSQFSARQSADNFDETALKEVVKTAHFRNVKVYVAMNTIIKDEELENFLRALLCVWNTGVDAIILQDLFLGKYVKERYPQIVLHASTQAGICTVDGAIFAKKCGFSRVILARETPLAEISKISKIIETEAFVQGALCTCFSGQCYFSSFAGENSGNRGRCKQPCRKKYSYNRLNGQEMHYALSLSDLCVGEDIVKYIDAGVTSFKIEGRMRRAEYVGSAVQYYRHILDGATEKQKALDLSDLKRSYNRGNYTKGLAFGQDKRLLSTAIQGHIGEKVGVVKVINGKYIVESALQARQGDAFKILRDGKEVGGASFFKSEKRGFSLFSKNRLKNGDGVFITTDVAVNERVLTAEKRGNVRLRLYFEEGEYAKIEGDGVCLISEERLQSAQSRPLQKEELIACFSKTDGLPVNVEFEEVILCGNIFLAKSQLNGLRRAFFERLTAKICAPVAPYEYAPLTLVKAQGENKKTAVISSNFENLTADVAIYKPQDYLSPLPNDFVNGDFEKYVYFPAFTTRADLSAIDAFFKKAKLDGVYVENYGGITFAQERGLKIFAGTGLNLINRLAIALFLQENNAVYYAISKETNDKEMQTLVGENAFILSSGGIKLMDLCYCPFEKTCNICDKKDKYVLTDENGREFAVRRYRSADGACRFEVYNCAYLVGDGINGAGRLLDLSVVDDKKKALLAQADVETQKKLYGNYTSGHLKRGVL